MVKICGIDAGTPADKAGIIAGDCLISINGHEIKDVLEYMFYAAETSLKLEIMRSGQAVSFSV